MFDDIHERMAHVPFEVLMMVTPGHLEIVVLGFQQQKMGDCA